MSSYSMYGADTPPLSGFSKALANFKAKAANNPGFISAALAKGTPISEASPAFLKTLAEAGGKIQGGFLPPGSSAASGIPTVSVPSAQSTETAASVSAGADPSQKKKFPITIVIAALVAAVGGYFFLKKRG